MSAFFGTLVIGMVIGAMLTSLTFGLLDLMKRKDNQQEELKELVRWKSSDTSFEKSSSGEVGKISKNNLFSHISTFAAALWPPTRDFLIPIMLINKFNYIRSFKLDKMP